MLNASALGLHQFCDVVQCHLTDSAVSFNCRLVDPQAALAICQSHLACCRDLVEEDVHGGNAPLFPYGFTEEQWDLILECPIFKVHQTSRKKWRYKRCHAGRKRKGHGALKEKNSSSDSG